MEMGNHDNYLFGLIVEYNSKKEIVKESNSQKKIYDARCEINELIPKMKTALEVCDGNNFSSENSSLIKGILDSEINLS